MSGNAAALTPAMRQQAVESSALAFAAIARLKDRYPSSISYQDLLDYLLPNDKQDNDALLRYFNLSLRKNPEVSFDPKANTYRYKPPYDVANAEELLALLQRQELRQGIPYDKLKHGWPDCLETLNQLEREHKILITRQKKDRIPRFIWADEPSLYVRLEPEFVQEWKKISLPNPDKIRVELAAMQSKAAGEAPKPLNAAVTKPKAKKVRRGNKVTNTHMLHLDAISKGYSKK
ncbi:uncharacterized protein HMPREF1541_07357 [Cyphellophora europaea CBS 101466]|uniref:TFIIE beta domain-containing protein n=1 Tax=Cyphellophora europaea (strain CBS 101466) TaxID=1220924 RepID=W2RPS6_CYPE1|nr:uncharacterized protein HMPREF1541_07357 [Cyphellophora europaea CBS 101466]ETN37734.1 hypothetical protein HMPREF1541_07357 [Cyphellophora europaea CBS 101466]